jgi:hypothetical protein
MSNGLEYLDKLRIGFPELQWLQDEILQRLQDQFAGLLGPSGYGWKMRWTNNYEADVGWRIRNLSGGRLQANMQEGHLEPPYHPGAQRRAQRNRFFVGLDQEGRPLLLNVNTDGDALLDAAGAEIVVPDDGVWYTLVAKYATTLREPGTLTLTAGSTTVTGTGTEFTRLFDGTDPRASLIRIDSTDTAAGNEGSYRIATITDDKNLTLATPAPATEAGVYFRAEGEFFSGTPAAPDIHNHATVVWELVARTVDPPGEGLIAYDVMYDSGSSSNVNVVDRRFGQRLRDRDPHLAGVYLGGAAVSAPGLLDYAGAFGNTGTLMEYIAATHCRGGASTDAGTAIGGDLGNSSQLIVTGETSGANHILVTHERIPYAVSTISGPDHGAVDTITTITGGITGLCLVALPAGYEETHLLICSTGLSLQTIRTTDHGAAGSWTSSLTIANPTGSNTIQNPRAVMTQMGRVVVVFEYTDVGGTGDTSIRYVFSDDYGATWDTNSGDGYVIREEAGQDLLQPDIAEDDDGTLWVAWKRGDDEIRLIKGQGLNDPGHALLTAQQPLRGFLVSQQATGAAARTRVCGRPCLVPGPGGVLVVHQEVNTTLGQAQLWQSWVGNGRVTRVTKVVGITLSDVGSGEAYADMVVHPMPGGMVSIVGTDASAGASNAAFIYDYPLIPLYRSMDRFQGA